MKTLIIDDNALFREGLHYVLSELDKQVRILEAPDYARAIQHVSANPDLDLVLLDLHIPDSNGITILKAFTQSYPTMPVVIVSASDQRIDIQQSLDAGAVGYISKGSSHTEMLDALRLILSGETYVPPCE